MQKKTLDKNSTRLNHSTDDPPVHYLLEGLRRHPDSLHGIYAFQSDGANELTARWQHKGVESIGYSDVDGHRALWETLELWASLADEPQQWRKSVLDLAMAGPRVLKPHQRGQVAQVVSTYEGAKAFANAAPPADWLCVFDPQCRFERPRRLDYMTPDSTMIDPFALYGLDFDEIPQRSGDDSFIQRMEVPSGAWDVFAINDLDRQDLSPESLPAVRPLYIPPLPPRLSCLGTWIANVANQASTVWWAVRQESLVLVHGSINSFRARQAKAFGLSFQIGKVGDSIRSASDFITPTEFFMAADSTDGVNLQYAFWAKTFPV